MILRRLVCLAGLFALLSSAGCGSGQTEGEREFEEQVEVARQHAREREEAGQRARRVMRKMRPQLRAAPGADPGCGVEYAPAPGRDGILPIACGTLGRSWPLTVRHGFLRCEVRGSDGGRILVFTAPGGREYALNSAASAVGYESVKSIRRPVAPRVRAGALDPLRQIGYVLCPATGTS